MNVRVAFRIRGAFDTHFVTACYVTEKLRASLYLYYLPIPMEQ